MNEQFQFSSQAWEYNNTRLTNQIFKLLPMYEHKENWESQKESIVLELHGYNDLFINSPQFMTLIAKLNSLNHVEDQMTFRKIIFETISCLKEITI